jgi:hypothetical protein
MTTRRGSFEDRRASIAFRCSTARSKSRSFADSSESSFSSVIVSRARSAAGDVAAPVISEPMKAVKMKPMKPKPAAPNSSPRFRASVVAAAATSRPAMITMNAAINAVNPVTSKLKRMLAGSMALSILPIKTPKTSAKTTCLAFPNLGNKSNAWIANPKRDASPVSSEKASIGRTGKMLFRRRAKWRIVPPNVRAKRETAVWRLAREAHDEPQRVAGQVPRRWLSA